MYIFREGFNRKALLLRGRGVLSDVIENPTELLGDLLNALVVKTTKRAFYFLGPFISVFSGS